MRKAACWSRRERGNDDKNKLHGCRERNEGLMLRWILLPFFIIAKACSGVEAHPSIKIIPTADPIWD